jgi:HlyD family secretion protein
MTANIKIQVAKRSNAVRVPNAALRFRPNADIFAALNQPVPAEAPFGAAPGGRAAGAGGESPRQPPATRGRSNTAAPPLAAPSALPTPPGPQTRPDTTRRQGQGSGDRFGSGIVGSEGVEGSRGAGQDVQDDRRARMLERLRAMPPDVQRQFVERMRERGQDVSGLIEEPRSAETAPKSPARSVAPQPAQTIDALFAPLPTVESQGRVWLYMSNELKPVRLRLGITDGTSTEVTGGELEPGMEVVTGVVVAGARSTPATGSGNPLMPQRGFGGPPGGFGRGR